MAGYFENGKTAAGAAAADGRGDAGVNSAHLDSNTNHDERQDSTYRMVNGLPLFSNYDRQRDLAYGLTDTGNAARFATRYMDKLRYCAELGGWMFYDGERWVPDKSGRALYYTKLVAWSYYGELTVEENDVRRKLLRDHARSSETATRRKAMLDLARAELGMSIEAKEFDTNPWALNCLNGTLDLRTGELSPHRDQDFITKLAPVDYDPEAKAPLWHAHLERFLPDPDVRREVKRNLGVAVVGETLDEILPIWYGTGGNGKTTSSQVLQRVLGDYAQSAAPNLLVQSKYEAHPAEVADLRGSRLAFSVEIGDTRRLDEAKVKRLTGGDVIKAHFMRENWFSFKQTFTIVMLVNHLPIITGADEAIWRRVRLIPWVVQMPESERLPQAEIVAALAAEGPGILRWIVEGLADWQQDHHWVAETVSVATANYRQDQDRLAGFLVDRCELGPHYSTAVGEFYTAYSAWCTEAGEESLSKRRVTDLLAQRGVRTVRTAKGVRRLIGVRVTQGDANPNRSPHEAVEEKQLETASPCVTPVEDPSNDGRVKVCAGCEHYRPSKPVLSPTGCFLGFDPDYADELGRCEVRTACEEVTPSTT